MVLRGLRRVEQACNEIETAFPGAVTDATANDKIAVLIGFNRLRKNGKMVRCPNVVVPEIANPASARMNNAFVVWKTLAAGIVGQIAPDDFLPLEGPYD